MADPALSLRLFFALPLPDEVCRILGRWQRSQGGSARVWCRSEGLHLTLAYLGARSPDALPGLDDLGHGLATRHGPFRLQTAGLGGFPSGKAARILWLGLEPCPDLDALVVDLRSALEAASEPFDAKPFRPHLTLARFRRPLPIEGLHPPAPMLIGADRLVLFESRPQEGYVPLKSWPLG
ncbi:MAG TPA: RNA 2',3'-cyclic phosphodiesterase [Geothrix sp.]|nr:RNA 2',3'-cyclic phosphodiesterase [Geothrix sp.]